MKHFLSTAGLAEGEFAALLDRAAFVKTRNTRGGLEGRIMGMVFFNPSLRTRTSFEAAMVHLGGHAVNLEVGRGIWSLETETGTVMDGEAAEHVKEAAPVLSRYADVLGVRCFGGGRDLAADLEDRVIAAFARYAEAPVINMESAVWHPCQALADALTWREQGLGPGDSVVLAWTWHPRALPHAVPNSVVCTAARMGLDVAVLRPEPFSLDPGIMDRAETIAARSGGAVRETDDPSVLEGARIVYAKSWGSLAAYGRPEDERALREPFRDRRITPGLMARTGGAKFMHCLPVRRNVVADDAVLDSPASLVKDQAENRLHAQKALLLSLLSGKEGR